MRQCSGDLCAVQRTVGRAVSAACCFMVDLSLTMGCLSEWSSEKQNAVEPRPRRNLEDFQEFFHYLDESPLLGSVLKQDVGTSTNCSTISVTGTARNHGLLQDSVLA